MEDAQASVAAFQLLSSCVRSPLLSLTERRVLFDTINSNVDQEHVATRFQLLVELTDDGKNVEAFEGPLLNLLARLLGVCFDIVSAARKKEKKTKATSAAKEEECLASVFRFSVDVIKFNPKLVQEHDFAFLLDQVTAIARGTLSHNDISNAVGLVDALATYTDVPRLAANSCVELLCDIYHKIKPLREQTWLVLSNVFRSHLSQMAISMLLRSLAGRTLKDGKSNARASFSVLAKLVRINGKDDLPRVRSTLFVPALKASLSLNNRKHESEVLNLFVDFLSHDDLTELLLEEPDWGDLADVCVYCAGSSKSVTKAANGDDASVAKSGPSEDDGLDAEEALNY
ncbi:hypothetical protein LTS18_000535, partial [Coniosporium uncinatum]